MPTFPLRRDHFSGGANLPSPYGLVDVLNAMKAETDASAEASVEGTTESRMVWVHAQDGDNANDGLTLATAKKTFDAASALLPTKLNHICSIQVRGKLPDNIPWTSTARFLYAQNLYIDGGPDVVELLASTAADISSVNTIGVAAAPWTAEQFTGKGWVEILDGPAAGERRSIQKMTASTITVSLNFSADPGACSFRIVRPATELNGFCYFTSLGAMGGAPILQRLRVGGGTYAGLGFFGGPFGLTHIVNDSTYQYAMYVTLSRPVLQMSYGMPEPENGYATNSLSKCGVSKVGAALSNVGPASFLQIRGATLKNIYFVSCSACQISDGTRLARVALDGTPAIYTIENVAAAPPISISGGDPYGLLLVNSSSWLKGGEVDVSDNVGHGVRVQECKLTLDGNVTGSGNSKTGVWAHAGSVVHTLAGTPPTLTGTIGDVAVEDPDAQQETWANIELGTSVESTKEMTVVRKDAQTY